MKEDGLEFTIAALFVLSLLLPVVEGCKTEDCNRNGECINGRCICIAGFFDDTSTPESDCDKNFADANRVRWNAMRFTYFGLFMLMSTTAAIGLYATKKNANPTSVTVTNIRKLILLAMCIIGISRATYYAYDPKFKGETTINWLFFGFPFPLALSAFFCVLFYWIDLYNVAVDALKKEEMLQKINSKYMGKTITFEDVVNRIRFLRRLKVPFITVVVIVFIMWAIVAIFYHRVKGYRPIETSFYAFVILVWIVLGIGFLTYGRKLVQLMPPQITKKVKKLTRSISILVIVIIVVMLFGSIFATIYEGISGPEYYLGQFFAVESMMLIICSSIIALFAKPSKRFPYCFGKASVHSSISTDMHSVPSYDYSQSSV